MSAIITQQDLLRAVGEWLEQGRRVGGPARLSPERVLYRALAAPGDLALEGFIRPANSLKEFVFPRHEKLYGYRRRGREIELAEAGGPVADAIVVGARPCDAAALPILDRVFNWDCRDEFYNRRRDATAVVTLACAACDEHCFCTSVGLGPAAERGSDVLLLPLTDGQYEVRCLTEKGEKLFSGRTRASEAAAPAPAFPEVKFSAGAIRDLLAANFDSPIWDALTLRCLGCGICTYGCPTCHCFDMVDEGHAAGGCRAKNWDSCQFAMFTLHASGHNPRPRQPQRQRQRVQHKFRIYPEKFGDTLCTGCGNCARGCPVGLGILETVRSLHATVTRAAEGG